MLCVECGAICVMGAGVGACLGDSVLGKLSGETLVQVHTQTHMCAHRGKTSALDLRKECSLRIKFYKS